MTRSILLLTTILTAVPVLVRAQLTEQQQHEQDRWDHQHRMHHWKRWNRELRQFEEWIDEQEEKHGQQPSFPLPVFSASSFPISATTSASAQTTQTQQSQTSTGTQTPASVSTAAAVPADSTSPPTSAATPLPAPPAPSSGQVALSPVPLSPSSAQKPTQPAPNAVSSASLPVSLPPATAASASLAQTKAPAAQSIGTSQAVAAATTPTPAASAASAQAGSAAPAPSVPCSTTASLNYTVSGGASSLLVQQQNGALDLIVWQENGGTQQSTINFGTQFGSVNIIDPTQGTTPQQTLTNAGSATVTLGNSPLILQLINPSAALPSSGGVKAITAAAMQGTEGVNTHLGYGSPYGSAQTNLSELYTLGISNVRDQVPNTGDLGSYQQLASAGIKFDLITSPQGENVATTLPVDIDGATALASSNPGSVISVEAPNELNGGQYVTLNGCNSQSASCGAAIVATVSAAVTGNSTLAAQGVGVVNVSINNGNSTWQGYIAGLGNLDSYVSDANWHVYYNNGAQPGAVIASMVQDALVSAPGKPVEITETGYETSGDANSVSEQAQAQQTLKIFLDAAAQGVKTTYLYELENGGASGDGNPEDNYGLFNDDGSPKPAAIAIQNFNNVLNGGSTDVSQLTSNGCAIVAAPSSTGVTQNVSTGQTILTQINSTAVSGAVPVPAVSAASLVPQTSLSVIPKPVGLP